MPCATSPSAMPFTSSSCSPQNSAICLNVSVVFSTSQTAVAFCINGSAIAPLLSKRFSPEPKTRVRRGAKVGFRGEFGALYRPDAVRVKGHSRRRRTAHDPGTDPG